jgi:hypothetical protein
MPRATAPVLVQIARSAQKYGNDVIGIVPNYIDVANAIELDADAVPSLSARE